MKTIFSAQDDHRQATWLELFFDLIFVAVIDVITEDFSHIKHGTITINQIIHFAFSFIPLWWVWTTHTLFANRFDNNHVCYKIHTLLIMALLIFLSSSSSNSISNDFIFFVSMYCIIRLVLAFGYYIVYKTNAKYKSFTGKEAICILTGAIISGSSLFLKDEYHRMIIFFAGILYETIAHMILCRVNITSPINRKHLIERTGILTVIIMGQTVVSIITGLEAHEELTKSVIISSCASFIFISTLWFVYFDSIHFLEKAKLMKDGVYLTYSHLLFYMGLIILACLIKHTILEDINRDSFSLLIIIGSPLLYLGRQLAYFLYYPALRLIISLLLCSLISIVISVIGALFFDISYAFLITDFAMAVYLLLVKVWMFPSSLSHIKKYMSAKAD